MKKMVIKDKITLASFLMTIYLGTIKKYSIEDLTAYIYYSIMKGFISLEAFFGENKKEEEDFDFSAFISQYDQKDYEKFVQAVKESDSDKAKEEAVREYVGKPMSYTLKSFTFEKENYLKELLAFKVMIKEIISKLKSI